MRDRLLLSVTTALVAVVSVSPALAQPASPASAPARQAAAGADAYPAPQFADPARRARLEAALADIEPAIRDEMQRMRAPGLAWGVVIDRDVVRSGGMGVRNVTSAAAVDADTVFRIASMTKSFTALAILALRDEGKLSLDDRVSRHVPEFAGVRLPTADSPPVTIRHLLTHSEGFPEDNPWGDRQLAVSDGTLDTWLGRGLPFSTAPGTEYEYSNYGFAILGRIVANVSGMPYRDYVTRHILERLGMSSTTFEPRDVPAERAAAGYRPTDAGWDLEPSRPHGAFGAMGGLLTSTRDLGRYVAFMLSAWPPRDEPDRGPVKRSSLREMQQGWRAAGFSVSRRTPDSSISATSAAYGYGLRVTSDCRVRYQVSHGGGLPGFGTNMTWLPEYGVGVVVMANRTYAPAASVARVVLERLAASGALQPRRVAPSPVLIQARDRIVALLNRWDAAAMTAMAADNLLLDQPLEARRQEMAAMHDRLGTCRGDADIAADNWLRGTVRLPCERGSVLVRFTLAPTQPPLVQWLSLVEAHPLEASLARTVESLARLADGWDEERASALLAADAAGALRPQLAAIRLLYGSCGIGEMLAGDGRTDARVRLDCERGRLDVHVQAVPEGSRIASATFSQPPSDTCVP
jgi:CubicO group peptidase (beta-lactamase class C family)